jgi:hypothetical protein
MVIVKLRPSYPKGQDKKTEGVSNLWCADVEYRLAELNKIT